MVDKIDAREKKMKSACRVKFDESLNSTHIYSIWFVNWWHLPKKGAKIGIDKRCPRCGGALWVEAKIKFESRWRSLGKLIQIYFWCVVILINNELKRKRKEKYKFPVYVVDRACARAHTHIYIYMCAHTCVCDDENVWCGYGCERWELGMKSVQFIGKNQPNRIIRFSKIKNQKPVLKTSKPNST